MKFETLDSYYNFLENDSNWLSDINTSKYLIALRDKLDDSNLKSICQYEIYFNDFQIEGGKVKPQILYGNGDSYPNYLLFDDDLEYIKTRAENTANHKYKSKYNHLLWDSKHKHISYAKTAIDSYFSLVSEVSISADDNISHHLFERCFQNLFILSQTVNYKKSEVIDILISLLSTDKINGYKKYSLIKYILEEGKKIELTTLRTFYDYCNNVIDNSFYPHFLRYFLELQLILCHKLTISSKPFHNKLAEFFISESEKDKESFIVYDFFLKALEHYKKAGNKEKMEEISILVEKVKRTIGFKSNKVEHTDERLQIYWDAIIKITDELSEKADSKDIYEYIILNDRIFPKAEVLSENIRPVTFDFVTVVNFDINKNITGNKNVGISPYDLHIRNFSANHLWLVFSKGLKSGKISFETLINFLRTNSWYGQDFTFLDANSQVAGFDWIELLSPSLLSFFTQSEIDIKQNKNSNTGYILPIDSLVIKFEGLLREFSRHIGARTIEVKDKGTSERISFEKLLENQKLKDIIPEDDIALFKYLFTSDGMDLRNDIAHCFYKSKDYSAGIMFLLIAALLKLGNYRLRPM